MTIYYVAPSSGSDANSGLTPALAWISIQHAFDVAVAGDIVYAWGTENISATVDVDINYGYGAPGHIHFVGVNPSWQEDGTRFKVNAGNVRARCLLFNAIDSVFIRNFEFTSATTTCVEFTPYLPSNNVIFSDCIFRNGVSNGFDSYNRGGNQPVFIRCAFYANGVGAIIHNGQFIFCHVYGNTSHGIHLVGDLNQGFTVFGSIIRNNADDGIRLESFGSSNMLICNSVIDSNLGHGIHDAYNPGSISANPVVIGCRITNNGNAHSDFAVRTAPQGNRFVMGWNYMPGTSATIRRGNYNNINIEPLRIFLSGADTNNISGTDTSGGYNDPSALDFTLATSAWGYNLGVNLL